MVNGYDFTINVVISVLILNSLLIIKRTQISSTHLPKEHIWFLLWLHLASITSILREVLLVYPLFTPCLPLVYPLFIPCLPLVYPFFIPCLSLVYPLFKSSCDFSNLRRDLWYSNGKFMQMSVGYSVWWWLWNKVEILQFHYSLFWLVSWVFRITPCLPTFFF